MALLERVATLVKANLNDLIDKAENPEKLLKQLLLDMENQFLQLKTQVAIAIADQHLLEKKQRESLTAQQDYLRKAELALAKNQEDLARAALERALGFENAAQNFAEQLDDQTHQVQMLREALHRLEQKMSETKTRTDLLRAQHRRARLALATGVAASVNMGQGSTLKRVQDKISETEALGKGHLAIAAATGADERLQELERNDRLEHMLSELKHRVNGKLLADSGTADN
jgi:phage shock protein A